MIRLNCIFRTALESISAQHQSELEKAKDAAANNAGSNHRELQEQINLLEKQLEDKDQVNWINYSVHGKIVLISLLHSELVPMAPYAPLFHFFPEPPASRILIFHGPLIHTYINF